MARYKCDYLNKLKPALVHEFGMVKAVSIHTTAQTIYQQLCQENETEPQALRRHTRKNIYPAIAAFQAMLQEGMDRTKAADLLFTFFDHRNQPAAKVLRGILKIPGLYKRVPRLFSRMTKKYFGEAAGFRADWHCDQNDEIRFDMLVCPYQEICARYGCPELVSAFCHADDVCYGDMHPRLQWTRTKTLGYGGDCCDFGLRIR